MENRDKVDRVEQAVLASLRTQHTQLEQARRIVSHLSEEHRNGAEWVEADDLPFVGLAMLRARDTIHLVRFNDGKHYAQLVGAIGLGAAARSAGRGAPCPCTRTKL